MAYIKSIQWLSEEALEAEVIVSDGVFELTCFSHPFNMNEGDLLLEPLTAISPSAIKRQDEEISYAQKTDSSFAYMIKGKILNKQKGEVMLGDILINVDTLLMPADLIDGDYVGFFADRIDV